ncbi:hypothetical protein ABLN87_19445 [Ruegeria sp. SCPT10]|uniref:hypothetical protein n=1 Tax=Ruegeria sp. SCP10 TaxID=3141377 RepID=UPI00333ADA86
MRFVLACFSACFLCASPPANAQEATLSRPDLSASGQDYLKAVRYRGIDTDVLYFDPTKPAPPLDTDFTPQAENQPVQLSADSRWIVGLVSAIALIFLALFIHNSASKTSVSFRRSSDNTRRKGRHGDPEAAINGEEMPDLDALLRLKDRDLAVTGLAQLALSRCLAANEVLFKRSWTHREALRSMPQNLWYIPDLRALVLESERVNFGHHSISEDDFDALLSRIRPVLREVRA